MNKKPSPTRWWVLYLILPLTICLFWWETRAPLSLRGHEAAEVSIVLFSFALVWLWLSLNPQALITEGRET